MGAAIGAMCCSTICATSLGVVGAAVGGTVGSTCLGASGGVAGAAIGHYVRKIARRELQDAPPEAPRPLAEDPRGADIEIVQPLPICPQTLLEQQQQGLDIVPPLPEEFFCPIGLEIMIDPVTDSLGYTYERALIEQWFGDGNSTSPVTNLELPNRRLVPNHSLRSMIMMANDKELQRIKGMEPVAETEDDDFVSVTEAEWVEK